VQQGNDFIQKRTSLGDHLMIKEQNALYQSKESV